MVLLPLGGAVINLCSGEKLTSDYKCEFYKDMRQYIAIGYGLGSREITIKPEKYTYTTGLMKEFSLEILPSNKSYGCDGEMILQDYNSNDLLKFVFLKNKFDIYLGSIKLNKDSIDTGHFIYIIYKNNKLYGYYNPIVNNFEKIKTVEIFSVDAKIMPYQIEFNTKTYNYYLMWLLRISHKADDLYYVK